jgi:hypothetical protein
MSLMVIVVAAGAGTWAAAHPVDVGDSYCGTVFTQQSSARACEGALTPYTAVLVIAAMVVLSTAVLLVRSRPRP